ncbi:hypothetical protein GON01_02050 [Sphingomonas sp. MAH-20]|uniref:Uncharacterized protein n=1 Tax=Sphingomonas horti TaxID=2682842 RepID=A0A6I4IX93_9SPHN|nr:MULTISPECIES: hypothetical protein [Sphingomonas]MBA2920471.1 hypothetical protein [Sphingomonas sp. CGMCC 1.13658]MVO76724.1 hypothetical protein [Sphingomonas horti]
MKLPRLARARRTSSASSASSALEDYQDVVPGEGGEGEAPATIDSGMGDDYDPGDYGSNDVGTTSGTATLNLEVALLSIAAVDAIAEDVAATIAAAIGKASAVQGVVLASPDLLAAMRLRASLMHELDAIEAVLAVAAQAPATTDADAAAFALPAATIAVQGLKRAAQGAASALTVFGVTTRYSGRKDTVRQPVLDAALAKHLARGGIAVRLPAYSLPAPDGEGLIARALTLQARCRAAEAGGSADPQVTAAAQAVDAIVGAVFAIDPDRGGGSPAAAAALAQQLMLADGVALAAGDTHAVLFAQLTVTGGSYRARKWLFNFLTGSDGLTYNGGAAVTFFLLAPDQRATLASDTVYFASPHRRFRDSGARPRPTNIAAKE